jgi:hypothetical protein
MNTHENVARFMKEIENLVQYVRLYDAEFPTKNGSKNGI